MDMSVVELKILCIQKDFHSGILKLFERNFHQDIKLHIICTLKQLEDIHQKLKLIF